MPDLRAFIVEDSPVIRDNLIAALEEMVPLKVVGFAENEIDAVRWLSDKNNACDLAIIDIFLRAGSGLGVLRSLKAYNVGIERVVLTNYASVDIRRQCLQLGASRVFDKSNEIDALIGYCLTLFDPLPDFREKSPRA
ncbi:MAG: response regulator [Pseudomonadota bacterium]